ncbi:hypothetical protein [Neptuniibacter sp. 1_MG-2023]|uniref:hypothetical protein n=1 Tax=Neptuniibacter sp. 1_MG-2023 TaxID=3062662 RepID=UPI0026E172BD|nr:hypothetical protein [Neptuniibacter sp. 1_MG-2023]MDO6592864.1 hypothetical protein [Neptuniibacter sp. 1_MG-2023]
MKYLFAILIICLPSFAYALDKITLIPSGKISFQKPINYSAPFKKEYFATLEIGDTLSKAMVILEGKNNQSYRVAFQLETSLSVNAEGPHFDLTEWKHCTTEWHQLNITDGNGVVLPNFDEVNVDCFPEVNHDEIKAAVLAKGGEEWVRIFEGEGWPDGYSPVEISLSRVRIKIEKLINTQWRVLTVINVAIPMGC